jgi:bacterioferritin
MNTNQGENLMTQNNETLIEHLNQDLAAEYQAVIMYNTYAASVLGEHRKQLREFFRQEVPDELEHATFLADKIVALGGEPTTRIKEVPHADADRDMLENVRQAESDTIERYGRRRQQAEEAGDLALVNDLEEMISDETRHMEECDKILRGFSRKSEPVPVEA